jgi:hypothetical protein
MKFHGSALTGASFSSNPEVCHFGMVAAVGLMLIVIFNGMITPLNFVKTYQLVQKLLKGGGGQTHIHGEEGYFISLIFPL